MEPPPVQYVTTTDGINIAYTVAGSGRPFVFMPWPFSNVSLIWQTQFGRPLLEGLAQRFRVIQYDSRGQGMSTRGLSEYHSMDDYLVDLETVVDRLSLDQFVLYGAPFFCHVAVRYAAAHPDRVDALVLGDASVDHAWGGYEDIARRDWEFYLHTIASAFSLHGAPRELAYWRASLNQEDGLKMQRIGAASSIRDILPSVGTPTLILNSRRLTPDAPESPLANEGRALAALMPDARLILFDGFGSYLHSQGREPPAAVQAIKDFLNSLGPGKDRMERSGHRLREGPNLATTRLSPREVEVLRLVVEGKSNREIAEQLVISERTVINHLSHIFIKTGAENRAGATAYAFRHGLT